MSQCAQNYDWVIWTPFSNQTTATGTVTVNGVPVSVTMTSNFTFSSTPAIWDYSRISTFQGKVPNTTVPATTWSIGPGGITTMCFSQEVQNPVLMLASLGAPGKPVSLSFSQPYSVAYDGGDMTYTSDTTIAGAEGYAVILFPGNFTCVTIHSSTPEYYTNISWGLNPPLFPVSILGNPAACDSVVLTASGADSYQWSGGTSLNAATNTFYESGSYFVTATDTNGCTATVVKTVTIKPKSFATINKIICAGQTYLGHNTTGTYLDTLQSENGCDSIQTTHLTVAPLPSAVISASSATITSGTPVTFSATTANLQPPITYQWFKNNQPVGSNSPVYTNNNLNNNDSVWVSVTGSDSCSTVVNIISNTITVAVTGTTCTGSVGDPIVNETFGSGEGLGAPLSSDVTNLQYVTTTCPNDGQYTITNYTANCWGSNWYTTRDHTGDANGYFMLVNASYTPNIFYSKQVGNLCEGTTYQFSSWVLNLVKAGGILPNITFTIEKTDGTILSTYQTGNIANSPNWNQYSFDFTLPAGVTDVVLRMRNNAPGGGGNDLALDDITFRPVGPKTSVSIQGEPADSISINACDPPAKLISSVEQCYAANQYQWQVSKDSGATWADIAGANQDSYAVASSTAGNYKYRLTVAQQGNIGNASCRVQSNAVTITVLPQPGVKSGTATISSTATNIVSGKLVTFTATTANIQSPILYQWYKNNQKVGGNSSVYTDNNLNNNDSVWVLVSGFNSCNAVADTISNKIIITVTKTTCTGSLGNAIVNETFGSGTNYGPPLPSGTTSSLGYQAQNCPTDGNYTITNYTSGCWPPPDVTWFTLKDHTGDANGYFMLVNASYNPSDFYIKEVSGLCEGATYEFSSWIINMCSNGGIKPNITFTIEQQDGTVLATYQSGDIPSLPSPQWERYFFYFTTPAGVSDVVLRMRNNAPGGVGNDVGLDDITFRPAGPAIAVGFTGITGDTATVCANNKNSLQLFATVDNCYLATAYQWQISKDNGITWEDVTGATAKTYTLVPIAAGAYLYRLEVAQSGDIGVNTCSVASSALTVIVNPVVQATVTIGASASDVCQGSTAVFTLTSTNGGSSPTYQWLLNGQSIGSGITSYQTSSLHNGDQVSCIMASSLACSVPDTSNVIKINVKSPVTPSIAISTDKDSICSGSPVRFIANAMNGGSTPNYQWLLNGINTGTNSNTFTSNTLADGDVVSCSLTSSDTCVTTSNAVSNSIRLRVFPLPNVDAGNFTIIEYGNDTLLNATATGNINDITWSPSAGLNNSKILDPIANPTTTTLYTLTVQTTDDCIGTDTVTVKVIPKGVFIPTAFSPNHDGINDTFKPIILGGTSQYSFTIFNRWGQKVFENNKADQGWDGTINSYMQPSGTYIWILSCTLTNGQTIHTKGTVVLIR